MIEVVTCFDTLMKLSAFSEVMSHDNMKHKPT